MADGGASTAESGEMMTTIGSRRRWYLAIIAMAQLILGVVYPGVPDR
jgi:hypothetical protein